MCFRIKSPSKTGLKPELVSLIPLLPAPDPCGSEEQPGQEIWCGRKPGPAEALAAQGPWLSGSAGITRYVKPH